MAEQVTIYWVDHHFGMHPPTLESVEGSKTEKQVRYKARYGRSYEIMPIERACFTPQDAIKQYRANWLKELGYAEAKVREIRDGLAAVDELEKGLLT